MYEQSQLIKLLEENSIPAVIIKGAAASMYYPHPTLRSMGDVDVLVKRIDVDKATDLLTTNGYNLIHEMREDYHHYNYSKDSISIELHKRLGIIDDSDEELLTLFERGIDERIWKTKSAVSHAEEFKTLHTYYTTRPESPLKKMQSLIVIACKILRVIFTILRTGRKYDPEKMLKDIRHPENATQAA